MAANGLLGTSLNCLGDAIPSPGLGRCGAETGPRSRDDDGVASRIIRKEVPRDPVYRAPAPFAVLPPAATGRRPARTRPRRHPHRSHGPAGPQGRGSELEVRLLHPLADLLGLLLAGAEPRSLLPRRRQADRRLARAPRSEDQRRGYQPVLQGPGAPARSGPLPLDAIAGPRAARRRARGVAV